VRIIQTSRVCRQGEDSLRVLFGHNTDVSVGDQVYHVQTEDRGAGHAVIDTTVYCGGRVLHRRTASYGDLLPLDTNAEELLKLRLDRQHQAVVKELRAGTLELSKTTPSRAAGTKPASAGTSIRKPGKSIKLELMNSRSWLSAGRATLQVAVRDQQSGAVIPGARVIARLEGADSPAEFSTATGAEGGAQLAFDMPRLAGNDAALVIEARYGESVGTLRFQLRAKPKAPAR
jgi:hypothetical protein